MQAPRPPFTLRGSGGPVWFNEQHEIPIGSDRAIGNSVSNIRSSSSALLEQFWPIAPLAAPITLPRTSATYQGPKDRDQPDRRNWKKTHLIWGVSAVPKGSCLAKRPSGGLPPHAPCEGLCYIFDFKRCAVFHPLAFAPAALAAPATAQSVSNCFVEPSPDTNPCLSYSVSPLDILEPWEDYVSTFSNGAVRVAIIDLVEPSVAAYKLLVMSRPYNELASEYPVE
jgi:hypothetical protein